MAYEQLKRHLIDAEGLELKPYRDSLGKLTIGVGRLIDPAIPGSKPLPPGTTEITREVALRWLDEDVEEKAAELRASRRAQTFAALDEDRQGLVVDLCFQLGTAGFCGWNNCWNALAAGDWNEAADQLLDSKAAAQTTGRFFARAALMRNTANPQPDLEKLPPNRTSEQRAAAGRKRAPGEPPLRLPSETEESPQALADRSGLGAVREMEGAGAGAAALPGPEAPPVRPQAEEDYGDDGALVSALRLYAAAQRLQLTRTRKPFSELTAETQVRWALLAHEIQPLNGHGG